MAAERYFQDHERVPGVGQREPLVAPAHREPPPQDQNRDQVTEREDRLHEQRRFADRDDGPEEQLCGRGVGSPHMTAGHPHRIRVVSVGEGGV